MTISSDNQYLTEIRKQLNDMQEEYNLMVNDYNNIQDERVRVRLKNIMDKKIINYLQLLKEIDNYGNRESSSRTNT